MNSFFKKNLSSIIIIAVLVFLSYINIYRNDFLSDDLDGIVNNPHIGDLLYNLKSLSIPNIIRAIDFLIGGLNPWIFHLTNIIFHAANSILVFALLILLDGKINTKISLKKIALPTALIFALHPLHTEAVTWISGFPYILYTFFLILSLIFFIKNFNHKNPAGAAAGGIIAGIFYLLALHTSEKSAIFPLILIAVIASEAWQSRPRFFAITIIIFFLITGIFGLNLVKQVPGRLASNSPTYNQTRTVYNPLIQVPLALFTYAKLSVLPIHLTLYQDPSFKNQLHMSLSQIGVLIFFIITIILYKKEKFLFLISSIFFISLIPTLLPFGLSWVVAERYVYFGLIGFSSLLAVLLYKIPSKSLSTIILTLILSVYIILTLGRNSQWKSQDTLWPATEKESPNIPFAHNNMGDYYFRHGDYQNAIKEFSYAVELMNGIYPEALHNLANSYLTINEASRAAELYEKAISLNPNIPQSHFQLGITYLKLKQPEKAKDQFQKALILNPNYKDIIQSLKLAE